MSKSITEFTLNPKLSSTEHKADKASLYNFSKLKKSRKWLKVMYRYNTTIILGKPSKSNPCFKKACFRLKSKKLNQLLLYKFKIVN